MEELDRDRIPELTFHNWNSSFKKAFQRWAIGQGDAALIITAGKAIQYDQPLELAYGGQNGFRRYQHDFNRWQKFTESKRTILAKLLSKLSREILSKVESHTNYDEALVNADLLTIWQITEQVAVGRGAISMYQIAVRLLKLKQSGEYTEYANAFKDLANDLLAQGDAENVLNAILNALFIVGLNQEEFKDKLNPRIWSCQLSYTLTPSLRD